jgi:hypothetical protein
LAAASIVDTAAPITVSTLLSTTGIRAGMAVLTA